MPSLSQLPKSFHGILIRVYKACLPYQFFRWIIHLFQPEPGSIATFVHTASLTLPPGTLLLDVGAGSQTYRIFFNHCRYKALDLCALDKIIEPKPDIVADLNEGIPVPDHSYDAILNTSVLEHVKNPQFLVNEMHRILKKGGHLFLTAPQGWGLHDEPEHYFHFTSYGLKLLFDQAGFEVVFVKERGGLFRYLAVRLQEIPVNLLKNLTHPIKFFLALPLLILSIPFFFFAIPPLFTLLDYIFDKEKKFTLGYACHCVKKG